jgi:hypothetical protein
MRLALFIGVLVAALLVAGVIFARGDLERTPVPAINLGPETSEVTTTEPAENKRERKVRPKKNQAAGTNGGSGGANPAPAPPPVPAGDDDDDDEPDENEDDRDEGGDDD